MLAEYMLEMMVPWSNFHCLKHSQLRTSSNQQVAASLRFYSPAAESVSRPNCMAHRCSAFPIRCLLDLVC
jgi:hypothetical protein